MAPVRPAVETDGAEQERRLRQRLVELPAVSEARAREAAVGCRPSMDEVLDLGARLSADAHAAGAATGGARRIEVVLGVDFGTTSTKIVARMPYEAGAPAFAVPVPPFARAQAHPHLWTSRLWLAPDGEFSLFPRSGARVYCAIKANLMLRPGEAVAVVPDTGVEATAEDVASAFLALQVRQARGWLVTEREAALRRGRVVWSYNFGFPAASLDDAGLHDRYRTCVAAALALVDGPVGVTLSTVRAARMAVATDAAVRLGRAQAALVPEIAAAVYGFAKSARLEDGLYALVDVGGGTVDCCTFNLFKSRTHGPRCPIFAADVAMLGTEPWSLCEDDPLLAEHFRKELDHRQRRTIWRTRTNRYPKSDRWTGGLPVFFVGGGIRSPVHHASAHGLDAWLRRHIAGGGGTRVMPLPAPADLVHRLCDAAEVHRLAVAVGLSQPAVDIPEVTLPDAIEDATPPVQRPSDTFVGKDQV